MFGPDKCGNDHKVNLLKKCLIIIKLLIVNLFSISFLQLHFIFQHKNPKNGTLSEKHAKKPSVRLDDYFKDGKPHLYTLMIHPDNTFDVSVDYKIVNSGSLLEDFSPPGMTY